MRKKFFSITSSMFFISILQFWGFMPIMWDDKNKKKMRDIQLALKLLSSNTSISKGKRWRTLFHNQIVEIYITIFNPTNIDELRNNQS